MDPPSFVLEPVHQLGMRCALRHLQSVKRTKGMLTERGRTLQAALDVLARQHTLRVDEVYVEHPGHSTA